MLENNVYRRLSLIFILLNKLPIKHVFMGYTFYTMSNIFSNYHNLYTQKQYNATMEGQSVLHNNQYKDWLYDCDATIFRLSK
jgi:hypothetical protein